MGSLRSIRRAARRLPNLRMEILEDRVVPDGTPGAFYDPESDTPEPVPPPDAIPIEWMGQTRLASPGHWIVQVDNLTGTAAEQISAFQPVLDSLNLGLTIDTHLGLDGMFRLAGPANLTVQVVTDSFQQVEGFLHIAPDLVEASGQVIPNDTDFNRLWGMHNTGNNPGVPAGVVDIDIDAPEAWDLTGPSRGTTQIIIAIDDSGVDYTHPDLYLNIWLNQTEIPAALRPTLADTDADGLITFWDLNAPANAGRVADNNGNFRIDAGDILRPTALAGWMDGIDGNAPGATNGFIDDFIGWDFFSGENNPNDEVLNVWHGTHVAGTIGRHRQQQLGVAGVNWKTQMMIVRGLGPANNGPFSALIGGLNYAVNNGAPSCRTSWGGFGLPRWKPRSSMPAIRDTSWSSLPETTRLQRHQ